MLLVVLASAVFAANAFALQAGEKEVDITLTQSYASRYIWRGQDLFATHDGAYQPSVDVSVPEAFSGIDLGLNVWASIPTNRGHEDAEEVDYTFTLAKDVLDDNFNVALSFIYYDFPNTASTADVSEPGLTITLNKIPHLPIDISMFVFAAYDFKARSGGPDEGWYFSWGFDAELDLPNFAIFQDEQTLALGIVNWGNDGVADLDPDTLYATEFSAATSYTFGNFTFTPNLHYALNYNENINDGNDEIWGGLEVSYTF